VLSALGTVLAIYILMLKETNINGVNKMSTTLADINKDGNLGLHHTSLKCGYVSRKLRDDRDIIATPYKGHFGTGYTVDLPNYDSTRYCKVAYYVSTVKNLVISN